MNLPCLDPSKQPEIPNMCTRVSTQFCSLKFNLSQYVIEHHHVEEKLEFRHVHYVQPFFHYSFGGEGEIGLKISILYCHNFWVWFCFFKHKSIQYIVQESQSCTKYHTYPFISLKNKNPLIWLHIHCSFWYYEHFKMVTSRKFSFLDEINGGKG